MSEMQELLHRMGRMEEALGEQTRSLDRLTGRLDERCPAHDRRLTDAEAAIKDLQKRRANGNGGGSESRGISAWSGIPLKVILCLAAAVTALATAVSTIVTKVWGGP